MEFFREYRLPAYIMGSDRIRANFLEELLVDANRVEVETGETCVICLQAYGKLSAETGSIECAIRLPCNHNFGSTCIATWFRSPNNTCPTCRKELFEMGVTPEMAPVSDYSEDEGEAGGDIRSQVDEEELEENIRNTIVEDLYLSFRTSELSKLVQEEIGMSGFGDGRYSIPRHALHCVITMAVLIASHLLHEGRTFQQISHASGITADHLRRYWQQITPFRHGLIPLDLPARLCELDAKFMEAFMAFLPDPAEMDFSRSKGEGRSTVLSPTRRQYEDRIGDESQDIDYDILVTDQDASVLTDVCKKEWCGNVQHSLAEAGIAKAVLQNLRSLSLGYPSSLLVILAQYIMSYFVGKPWPLENLSLVARIHEIDENSLRSAYQYIYANHRGDLISVSMIERLDNVDQRKAWEAILPLNWPSLDFLD